jgi:3-deoxy-manno-octulosonate cytidylyltransferase (CMP-KDO synthetase)
MKVVGIIPARYASTRFPGKPLALIMGKPMIQRVYEQAQQSHLDALVVATDDQRIADTVRGFGGCCVITSPNHRSGTERCREAMDLLGEQCDAVVNIQGDEPFIDPAQINQLIELILRDDTWIASLAKRIEVADELFSPNTVKVVMDQQGKALYFSRNPIPFMRGVETKEWMARGTFYKHVGIYAYKANTLRQIATMTPTSLETAESLEQLRWLENGLSIRMGITETENVSIDLPEDVERAERFAENRMKTTTK